MQYFENHFTTHHFFHAPHKWFLALLISPIHFAELHYKKHYHLRFAHARKLFIFDLTLLASCVGLIILIIAWWLYDPTVTNLVDLTIEPVNPITFTPDNGRIRSGDDVGYHITYRNRSRVELKDVVVHFYAPNSFVLTTSTPITTNKAEFKIGSIRPNVRGEIMVSGIFYGTPEQEEHVAVEMSYTQVNRAATEIKWVPILTTLRGSVLEPSLQAPQIIPADSTAPVTLQLYNHSPYSLSHINVPLTLGPDITIQNVSSTRGHIDQGVWFIDNLASAETASLHLQLGTHFGNAITTATLSFIPNLITSDQAYPQIAATQFIHVSHPRLELTSAWQNDVRATGPGQIAILQMTIKNTGDSPVQDANVSLPLPEAIVDGARFVKMNQGDLKDSIFTITKKYRPDLTTLAPGNSVTMILQIPIRNTPQGDTDLILKLHPRVAGTAVAGSHIENTPATPDLAIGTSLGLQAEARYYTADGDQLGRGPLPPQVGKETKYGILIQLKNTTSQINDLHFSATLPPGINWTGKTSVNRGNDVAFNPTTRAISWSLPSLAPHDNAGVYFEVSLVPTETERGTVQTLVQSIAATGNDNYTHTSVGAAAGNISTNLATDARAKAKGVVIQ